MERKIIYRIVVSILVFTVIITILTTVSGLPINTNNEWIGYWGSVLGSMITLWVLYCTLKDGKENLAKTLEFEKNKIEEENKKRFNEEILNSLVEYYVLMNGMYGDLKDRQAPKGYDSKIYKSVVLSKLIKIKLKSKKENDSYFYVSELLESIDDVVDSFNKWVDMRSTDIFGDQESEINKQEKVFRSNIKKLEYDTEKYFISND